MQQQMKHEGWQNNASTQNGELARAPMDFEATSLASTPDQRVYRQDANMRRFNNDSTDNWGNLNGDIGLADVSSESGRQRSWGESLTQLPPPYVSEDRSSSRESRSRDIPMEEMRSSSRASGTNSFRDESSNTSDRTLTLKDSGGGGGKDEDLWV